MRTATGLACLILYLSATAAQPGPDNHVNSIRAEWLAILQSEPASELDTLARVNNFFNQRLQFSNDLDIWGEKDYWATPRETMNRGRGDCEDFVIAKYMTLLKMNLADSKLRLIYVRARIGSAKSGYNLPHMVLGYYPDEKSEPRILDNLVNEILPASRRTDLTPIFSFNSQGLWTQGQQSLGNPSARLSRWRNVLQRMSSDETVFQSPPNQPGSMKDNAHVSQQ